MLDRWRLKDFACGEGLARGAERGEGEDWIPVSAPGDTYVALMAAGRLADPFKGRGEAEAAWVRDREWWWTTTFDGAAPAAGERVELVFDGLDTFAAIYLDGELIGRTDNMFRRYAFDIGARLAGAGSHTLSICFAPTTAAMPDRPVQAWAAFADRVSVSKRNLMRKAQFGWGWDWGPDLPTVGVWAPVRLERRSGPWIGDIHAVTLAVSEARADLRVRLEVEDAAGRDGLRAEVTLSDPDGYQAAEETIAADGVVSLELTVDAPRLWWTADLGDQPLYDLSVRLFDGDTLLDEKTRRVGLRTLTLDTGDDPDEPGTSFFRFVLNGVPIFAKGVCWVPASSFVGEVDDARYRDLIGRAAQANMNMIRVWGGGIYEPDLFYDLCDETGLLVWQDFMFACAHYPEDDAAFVASVRIEAREQVRRLRGHACLALWCGNNENQVLNDFNNRVAGASTRLDGLLYYDEILPELVAELDPATPYRPSSPWGGPSPNSMRAGDVHNWTVWHGVPLVADEDFVGGFDRSPEGVAYSRYAEDDARFVSEFGIQAAPGMATLRRWMAPEDLVLGSEGFLGRVKDAPDKANAMMVNVTGLPATLEDYVDFTMWTQAEGMKFGIEHYRRRKPHCSGALIWQYNDCWPCISWSLIDYDGVAKASHYAVTRAFAPVMASFKPLGGGRYELWVTNDTLAPVRGEAVVALARLAGGADWSERFAFETPANGSVLVWRGDAWDAVDRVLTVRSAEGLFAANRHLLAPIARLLLDPDAAPVATFTQAAPGDLRVELSATAYLTFVRLTSERADLRFSDNYFDLCAGETRVVTVRALAGVSEADVRVEAWNGRAKMAPARAEQA